MNMERLKGYLEMNFQGGIYLLRTGSKGNGIVNPKTFQGGSTNRKVFNKEIFCGNCVIGCGREIKIEGGPYSGIEGAGPEYETVSCLGSNLLIDDLAAVCKVMIYVIDMV